MALIGLNSAKQVATKILSLEEDKKLLVIGFLWLWWDARNKANAGDKLLSTKEMVYKVHSMKYIDALHTPKPNKRQSGFSCMVPPSADILKINIDGAFVQKEKRCLGFYYEGSQRGYGAGWCR